ncbi:FAD/NAD(P)-binding domain containing protein [Trema orientale]|uniref:FAD/NAD(P)-binding domain containing protein n=1 Tax=Trema orientale TaxID=63057 RepID=A0A2P5EFU1_TREOI|nr:FAD/NAD(P)-binding domain containing protein [Trema orientale]
MAATDNSGAEKKRVVVVGGGVAGSFLARSLQFSAHVVLMDQKEYFEITWGSLRAMVEPSFAGRMVINHSDYLSNVQIVASTAANVTDSEVFTADGQSFAYDYLVIATGHNDSFPRTRPERLSHYEAEFEKIKSASSILIVGGGPTGVELAGEIAVDFPEKKLTIVHRGTRLLEFVGSKASQKTLDWLISKKVEVLLDQSVNLDGITDGVYQTSKGETITADCHFLCTGKPVGSSWLTETTLKDSLDTRGRLMVDEHLRVRGHNNVFGIGDITDIKEMKQGYIAQQHAQVAAKNLKLLLKGGKESKLAKYKSSFEVALISLGRKEGVAQFPLVTISGCIPGKIKSGDLFVGKTRKELGLKPDI